MSILITGGVGFIGSNFVLDWLAQSDETVINLDALTYVGGVILLCVIGSRYFFGGNLMKLKPTLAALFAAALITSPVLAQTPAPVAAPAPAGAAAAGAGAVGGVATTTLVLGAVAAAVVVSAIAGDGTVATVATQ